MKGKTVRRLLTALTFVLLPPAAWADQIPPCALTGSMTVTIGGKPALRLSDVANCPKELYDVINSVHIDGQPMVHFKSGVVGKTRCTATGSPSVDVEGKSATTAGDVACSQGK